MIPRRIGRLEVDALRRAVSEFRPALRGLRGPMFGAVGLTALGIALELLRPWPVQYLVDHVLLEETPNTLGVVLTCAAVLGIGSALGQVAVSRATLVARITRKATTRVRKRLFRHLHRLALPFHDSQRTGDLVVRLMGDVDMVRDLLLTSWLEILQRSVVMVGAGVAMFLIEPRLAALALIPLPLMVLGVRRSSRELVGVTRKQRRKQGAAAAFAAESLRQIRVVKAYAAEERASDEFGERTSASERAGGRSIRLAAGMTRIAEVSTGVGLAIVLFFGARAVQDGSLSVGHLLVLLSYTRALYKPVRKLARHGARLAKATACSGRVLDMLDIEPEDPEVGRPVPSLQGAVRFNDVTYRYGNGMPGLEAVSFDLAPGALTHLSGPNGAGKSTLLAMLLRLLRPDRGDVRVDGLDIESLRLAEYREQIAYVPQRILLFGGTVRENIAFGNPDATEERIVQAATDAFAHDFIEEMPDGYDSVLGEDGTSLSHGQARRVMLARAAVRDSSILLLDEPLAGLDPEAGALVARAIREIARGRTTIVVHHGEATDLRPDTVLHLERGRLVQREALA